MRKYLFSIVVFCSLCGCSHSNKKIECELKNKLGAHLVTPNIDISNDSILKICSFINGDCPSCVETLYKWSLWSKKVNSNVNFIFYFYSLDTNKIDYIKHELHEFNCNIVYDPNKSFIEDNNILDDIMFQTFLLNNDNKIMLVGNPLFNTKLSDLYLNEIYKVTKDNNIHSKL